MLLRDVLEIKGPRVAICAPADKLSAVVQRLAEENIGSLVVCERGRMVGIITERDILRAAAAHLDDLARLSVAEWMTPDPISGTADLEVTDVMGIMTDRRIRHLPVLENGALIGLVSIGDVVKAQHDELTRENHYLKNYLFS